MPGIAILDSGVGGLSIFQEVKTLLPRQQCVVVADNQAFPYGTKSQAELKDRVLWLAGRIIEQYSPRLLVIACNTASTVVLPVLRDTFQLPIVGVVPAIKPAAKLSRHKVIGILATPATIRRDYTDDLIQEYAADCAVLRVGSGRLVEIAEEKIAGAPIDMQEIAHEIKPFLDLELLDVLVLACTHFPLLNNEIRSIFKLNNHLVTLIDSGSGVANRIRDLMDSMMRSGAEEERDAAGADASNSSFAVFTQPLHGGPDFVSNLQHMGLARVEVLD